MHLTFEPDLTNFLKISKDTSSLVNISVISFIISDKASYINGENINIDGGWLGS